VTVGTTEWLFEKDTPSARIRYTFGLSVALIESGRRPSTMKTIVSGFPAARTEPASAPPPAARRRAPG
jgi:hypothetical protein